MDPKYFDKIKQARKTADLVKKIRNDEVIVLDEDDDLILLSPELEAELSGDELNDTIETFLMELEMEEAANKPECQMQICSMARNLIDKEFRKRIHKTAKDIIKLPDGWTLETLVASGAKTLNDMMELLVGKENLPSILNDEE